MTLTERIARHLCAMAGKNPDAPATFQRGSESPGAWTYFVPEAEELLELVRAHVADGGSIDGDGEGRGTV